MTEQEIRDNKPDGATHKTYSTVLGWIYIKYNDGKPYYWNTVVHKWYEYDPNIDIKPL